MKSLKEIQREAEKGDYKQVARLVDVSPDLVQKVIAGQRNDYHNIQKTFSDILEARARIAEREERRRIRNAKREAKRLAA